MSRSQRDIGNAPQDPQFPLGPTSSEAALAFQIESNPLQGPGAIVGRLTGQQFSLPANYEQPDASPDVYMSERPGINVGES